MSYTYVSTAAQLETFCDELATAETIAFDTEFVSEHTYRSQLCLVQVCTPRQLAVIDPQTTGDLQRFWEVLARDGHQTVVHAGREELVFALHSVGKCPADLLDVQIAAGLMGLEYPAGYGSLLDRMLRVNAQKGETRTDWRKRPLSRQQIEYALDDVRYLIPLRDKITERLAKLGRLPWIQSEMAAFQEEIIASRTRERWRRVSGLSGLSPRSLAVAREVWRWREAEAQRLDKPARLVLRDDLLVELARRRTADLRQIRALRGLERGDIQRALPKIAEHIQLALDLPQSELPRTERRDVPNQINVLGQFLSTALTSLCRSLDLAPALVGTASDVRDLVAFRMGFIDGEPPLLARGWRGSRGFLDRRLTGWQAQPSHCRSAFRSSVGGGTSGPFAERQTKPHDMSNPDSSSVSSISSSNEPNLLEAELLRIRRRLSWLTTAIFFLAFAFLLFVAAAYGAIVDYHASEGKLIAGACTGGTVMGFLFGWLARRAG